MWALFLLIINHLTLYCCLQYFYHFSSHFGEFFIFLFFFIKERFLVRGVFCFGAFTTYKIPDFQVIMTSSEAIVKLKAWFESRKFPRSRKEWLKLPLNNVWNFQKTNYFACYFNQRHPRDRDKERNMLKSDQ
jgi:hypothetical protein